MRVITWESRLVHSNHHVHGSIRHDRFEARYGRKLVEGQLCILLNQVQSVFVKVLGGLAKNGGHSALDQGVGTDNTLRQGVQTPADAASLKDLWHKNKC